MFRLANLFRNEEAHQAISKYNAEMLRVQVEAKKVVKHSAETLDIIRSSRGYKIAIATGGQKRGLK